MPSTNVHLCKWPNIEKMILASGHTDLVRDRVCEGEGEMFDQTPTTTTDVVAA